MALVSRLSRCNQAMGTRLICITSDQCDWNFWKIWNADLIELIPSCRRNLTAIKCEWWNPPAPWNNIKASFAYNVIFSRQGQNGGGRGGGLKSNKICKWRQITKRGKKCGYCNERREGKTEEAEPGMQMSGDSLSSVDSSENVGTSFLPQG